eukprot:m.429182 g.429182  ORF g.429182 m.429182 type:complete len:312 (+) comp16972_c0_seq1:360-1295(+)
MCVCVCALSSDASCFVDPFVKSTVITSFIVGSERHLQRGNLQWPSTCDDAGLHRDSNGHRLVRVDGRTWRLSQKRRKSFAHPRHPRRASNEHNFVDFAGLEFRFAQHGVKRFHRCFKQINVYLFKLFTCHVKCKSFSPSHIHFQCVVRFGAQSELQPLRFCPKPLPKLGGRRIPFGLARRIHPEAVIEQSPRHVLAPKMLVASNGVGSEHAALHMEQRNVQGPATPVEDDNEIDRFLGMQTIRHRCRGRLAEYSEDVEASESSSLCCGVPLSLVELDRDRHHGLRDSLPKMMLGCGFERLQHSSPHIFGRN